MPWITDEDWQLLQNVPERDLVDLAAELDMAPAEDFDRKELWERCVEGIVARGRAEGLPFSKYDRDDLAALATEHLAALAALQRVEPTVDAVLKAGARVYKVYEKTRPNSALALQLPVVLVPIARAAASVK